MLDQEEFLYLLNIVLSNTVKRRTDSLGWKSEGDQGWLNEVYRWEKFDIGQQYNLVAAIVQNQKFAKFNVTNNIYTNIQNATIAQFAGPKVEHFLKKNCTGPIMTICKKWKNYSEKLPWKGARI